MKSMSSILIFDFNCALAIPYLSAAATSISRPASIHVKALSLFTSAKQVSFRLENVTAAIFESDH